MYICHSFVTQPVIESFQIAWAKKLLATPSSRHHKKDPGKGYTGKSVLLAGTGKKKKKRSLSGNNWEDMEAVEEIGDDSRPSNEEEEWENFSVDEEEEGVDFDDNLSFTEDSLSIIKGEITLHMGQEVPVWITTDTGSMTRLIESEFVAKYKLPQKMIKPSQRFYINGPGGGREMISHMVSLDVRLKTKTEGKEGTPYDEIEGEEETRVVRMTFGVCRHLPVPRAHGIIMTEMSCLFKNLGELDLSLPLGHGLLLVANWRNLRTG